MIDLSCTPKHMTEIGSVSAPKYGLGEPSITDNMSVFVKCVQERVSTGPKHHRPGHGHRVISIVGNCPFLKSVRTSIPDPEDL